MWEECRRGEEPAENIWLEGAVGIGYKYILQEEEVKHKNEEAAIHD